MIAYRGAFMILTVIATLLGLSVITLMLIARAAPHLNEDGTFEAASSHAVSNQNTSSL